MPRPKNGMVRLDYDVSPGLDEAINRIAAENGLTKAEAIRRSVILADVMHEARKEGKHFGTADSPGKLQQEVVGI